jgi:hypothetical protein
MGAKVDQMSQLIDASVARIGMEKTIDEESGGESGSEGAGAQASRRTPPL